jgi:hypothetical protein
MFWASENVSYAWIALLCTSLAISMPCMQSARETDILGRYLSNIHHQNNKKGDSKSFQSLRSVSTCLGGHVWRVAVWTETFTLPWQQKHRKRQIWYSSPKLGQVWIRITTWRCYYTSY